MASWCYGTALSILQMLNIDSAVAPLNLAMSGILALWKFDWLINHYKIKTNAIELVQQYDIALSTRNDLHASLVNKKILPKPPNLWMTPHMLTSRRQRWYLNHVWHKTLLSKDQGSTISAICSSCIYHIRDLRHICRHLNLESAKLLANALVSSRLDYCNSVLSGIAETDLTKLQRILNHLARVVTKSPPFTRSVPLLRSFHWLPVKYRVHFKICLLTYRALHEEQPVYLRSLIATSLPSRSLRSNRGITLSVPRINTNTGTRAFSSCIPSLWNNLPLSVHSATSVDTFRRRLKPFQLALPPVDTGVPNRVLMLRNSLNEFVFEYRSGCCATEPGYAGDIGDIEIWLIDWFIYLLKQQ